MRDVYFGIDLGTANCSVAYVVDDPRLRDARIIDVQLVPVPVDEVDVGISNRLPNVLAVDWAGRKVGRPLFGWQFQQGFRRKTKSSKLLRRGVDYVSSAKSDLGTGKFYARSQVPGARTPAQAIARILEHICEIVRTSKIARDLRDSRVTITVPASLSAVARRETVDAAESAGLKRSNLELIDEPVAALLDLLNRPDQGGLLTSEYQNVLVFDYGAGTCDLSLVRARLDPQNPTGIQVVNLAISPYRRLGGDDIDRAIMEQVVWQQLDARLRDRLTLAERRGVEDTLIPSVARSLKERICREVTKEVSKPGGWKSMSKGLRVDCPMECRFPVPQLERETPARFTMTIEQFEAVMKPFLAIPGESDDDRQRSLVYPILETLDRGGLGPDDLDVLVLHGGSCQNPFVQRVLAERFAGTGTLFRKLHIVHTPDILGSVARGAALAGYWRHARGEEVIRPIIAEELGVITQDERPRRLIPAGEPLPYPDEDGVQASSEVFVVPSDDLSELLVPIYRGTQEDYVIAECAKFPLSRGIKAGSEVRVKLRVSRDKLLEWWFAVGTGDFTPVDSVDDPWTATMPSVPQRRLMEHRLRMRAEMKGDQPPSHWMQYREAALLRAAGQYEEALLTVEEMLEGNDEAGELHNLRGLVLTEMEQAEDAVTAFRTAVALNPGNAVFNGNLGCTLADCGHLVEATAALRRAISLNPQLSYVYTVLADVLRQQGDEAGAQRELSEALVAVQREIDEAPLDPQHWRRLAHVRRSLGDYRLADEAERQAKVLSRSEFFGGDPSAIIASAYGQRLWQHEEE